ncbi:arabinose-5-phosphate isomerase [Vigna unguiculata]|uniref:Arabinose-5-phosphate isomerase n=1 Tax=Vigna unguiculata TaxID=3917 RepID=A0A4D6N7Q4_VIGUN|nr:arabinose-5-phosphate isomerase [Vigna unguiculata]
MSLTALFMSQQSHLNFFFKHIYHSKTLALTCTLLNAAGTVFFTGVGKPDFAAHKISQTLMAITLMEVRNLTKEEYAANNPVDKIEKRLIFKGRSDAQERKKK